MKMGPCSAHWAPPEGIKRLIRPAEKKPKNGNDPGPESAIMASENCCVRPLLIIKPMMPP
jgi:hypothetical protein